MTEKAIKYGCGILAVGMPLFYYVVVLGWPYAVESPDHVFSPTFSTSRKHYNVVKDPDMGPREFKQGQIVLYEERGRPGSARAARVIAVEGDRIAMGQPGSNLAVPVVNGKPLTGKSFTRKAIRSHSETMHEIIVPRDHIFLLGDFRQMTKNYDSTKYGPLPQRFIFGWVDAKKE